MDRLTKTAHFLPVKTIYTTVTYAKIYFDRILSFHGVPKTIVSNSGTQFVSQFWKCLHKSLGTKLLYSSVYHPKTGGQTEWVNQTLEDHWFEPSERWFFGVDLVKGTEDKVKQIQNNLRVAQYRQKSYADRRRRPLRFAKGDHVYLKVSPMKGVNHFVVKGKLEPRYIGPFLIIDRCGQVAYHLKLPEW